MARSRTPVPAPAPAARLDPRVELARLLPSGRSLLAGFALLAAAAGSYAVARETPLFALRTVEVVGVPPASAAQVRHALRGELGSSLVALSGDSVLERVEALPDVVSASYDRDFPHTLRLVVRREIPIAVLRRGTASWLVSTRGRVIGELPRGSRPGLPRIWLPRGATVEIGGILDDPAGGLASRALASVRGKAFLRAVRGVVLSSRDGLVVTLRSGVRVKLGAPVAVALKLAVAEQIVASLPEGTTTLDVSVPERPVSDTNPQPVG